MKRLLVAVAAIVLLAACQPRLITDPGDGAIVASGPMPVSGSIPDDLPPGGTLTVNGVPTPINADGTWSTEITAGPDGDVNVIEAI
ncbi:MAG: hypothetical protein GX643_06805, partial [Acidimicrobiales bacterium]|nr:hypothetical protein [Acidimicrobiales bacterium]